MAQREDRTAIVGADFGPSGDDAIVEALRFVADGALASVHLVHVLDPDEVIDDRDRPAARAEQEVLARAPANLRDRAARLASAHGLPFEPERVYTHARLGKPVDVLLLLAADFDADLIVVGTHGRRGIDRLLLGSVAERLVRVARCPVLVARTKSYGVAEQPLRPDPPYGPEELLAYPPTPPGEPPLSPGDPRVDDDGPSGVRIV